MTIEHTPSSGNVFRDLGLDDPDIRLEKSKISADIEREINIQDLKFSEAAQKMEITRDRAVEIVRGNFDDSDSVDRLKELLALLRA